MERGIRNEAIAQGPSRVAVSLPAIVFAFASAILLATRAYWVSELLVFLLLAAILCLVGLSIMLLIVFLREGIRWSIGMIEDAKRIVELPMKESTKLSAVAVPHAPAIRASHVQRIPREQLGLLSGPTLRNR
jgi:hypothetical protein